jgi:hypothetical protein
MINSQMQITLGESGNTPVCCPKVRHNYRPWEHILLRDREKCGCIPSVNGDEKAAFAAAFHSSKEPLLTDCMSSVVLSVDEEGLVDLNDDARTSNANWVLDEVLACNVPAEIIPVDQGMLAEGASILPLEFMLQLFK